VKPTSKMATRRETLKMRKRNLIVILVVISCFVMFSAVAGTAQTQSKGQTGSAKDFQRAQFDKSSPYITNKYLPLKPGMRLIYKGSAIPEDQKTRVKRRVVTTVTDLSKWIDGVRTLVIWEKDYTAGELGESELAFFAQDKAGNVWLVGEYPEEYENRKVVDAPTWISGRKGAHAGIAMLANPKVGSPDYAQGFAPPPVEFIDRARVYKKGQKTCVPVECYKDVLVIEEFEKGVPGVFHLKYYAPKVGLVKVGWRGANEEEKETLALVKRQQLSSKAMAKARKTALNLDNRAYKRSADVYGNTPRAKPLK
jgi:hypothetical protein